MDVFISEIQKRNVLWNKLNPLYNHRLAVDKEWESVAECTSFSSMIPSSHQ
uniref:MADF domain-containing protein n=1 Tax=Rhodnius prolixus TaxID=13249 RepID=T1IC66_RHOPR